MSALRQLLVHFGFSFDSAALKRADQGVASLVDKVQSLGQILAGSALALGARQLFNEFDKISDLSAQLGISTDALQKFMYAAKQSDVEASEFEASLRRLAGQADELGGAALGPVFAKMQVATKGANGEMRALGELLPDVLRNFNNLQGDGEKAAAAVALFGRSGTKLLPFLAQGEAGLAALNVEFAALGGGASADALKATAQLDKVLKQLDQRMFALKNQIALAVFPVLEKVADSAGRLLTKFSSWAANTSLVENAVLALGATLIATFATALAPWLLSGLRFAGIFLAIDDLIAFLAGKDSLIGDLLNRAFGPGSATAIRTWLLTVGDDFAIFFAELFGETQRFGDNVNAALKDAFGSTAQQAIEGFTVWAYDAISGFVDRTIAKLAEVTNAFKAVGQLAMGDVGGAVETVVNAPKPNELPEAVTASTVAADVATGAARTGAAMIPGLGGLLGAAEMIKNFTAAGKSAAEFFAAKPDIAMISPARAPLPQAAGAQTTNTTINSTVTAPLTVNVPAGTPAQQARAVGKAAEQGSASANRSALSALERLAR